MVDIILKDHWTRWHPKKIFLKNIKNNQIILSYLDNFKKKDFDIDLNNSKQCEKYKKDSKLATDLTKTKAYNLGFEEGLSQGKKENILLKDKLNKLFLDFENALVIFENALFSRLLKTVLTVSSYVIGKSIKIDKEILLKYIKKNIDQDGIFLKRPQLLVHPKNKILIETTFKNFLNNHKWQLVYDDSIDVNGCKVKSDSGNADTTIAARWQELCRLVCLEED